MTSTNLYKIAICGGVCAVGAFLLMRLWNNNMHHPTFLTNKYPNPPQPFQLTNQEVTDYQRDGFLLKRQLITGEQLTASIRAGERIYHSFTFMDWIIKRGGSLYAKVQVQTWRTNPELFSLAFESTFPSITAQLLNETKSIRILKDGFFGQDNKSDGCGFHVDDAFFWPTTEDSTGVNFWMALSSTGKAHGGGGIRVVNQSLITPETFSKCKDIIRGKNTNSSSNIYNATCDMERTSPECHEIMMNASVWYDMNPGDVILWDRWTFHRGEPMNYDSNNKNQDSRTAEKDIDEHKMRYTIRYIPSHAVAEGMLHPTVTAGKTFDTPLHPQVWPLYREDEIDNIRKHGIVQDDVSFSWKMMMIMLLRKLGIF